MGYSVQMFAGAVDDNLLCSVCSQVLEAAVLTPCGHSFCQVCLDTWLARPACMSCPQCRSPTLAGQARPILSLRGLINTLDIHCDHKHRGCKVLTTLDNLAGHLEMCAHAPIQCAGCKDTVNKIELPEHQTTCTALAALLDHKHFSSNNLNNSSSPGLQRPQLKRSSSQPSQHSPSRTALLDLSARVSGLEIQLSKMKTDLLLADNKNQQLGQDLLKARQELADKLQLGSVSSVSQTWDTNYTYGYTPKSILRLASLLFDCQLSKPGHLDVDKVFDCVRRCYENFGHNRRHIPLLSKDDDDTEAAREVNDLHVLVAVAQSCVWFSDNQQLNFHCWLQSIARHRQFAFIQKYK